MWAKYMSEVLQRLPTGKGANMVQEMARSILEPWRKIPLSVTLQGTASTLSNSANTMSECKLSVSWMAIKLSAFMM